MSIEVQSVLIPKDRKKMFHYMFPMKRALKDTPKERRKQFMRTRYNKPKCSEAGCEKLAHYIIYAKPGLRWCRTHLPPELAERLTCEWQYTKCIIPYTRFVDKLIGGLHG